VIAEGDDEGVYARTMRLLERVAAWKAGGKERADLSCADLSYAYLRYADLSYAVGVPRSGMPDGWKLNDAGLWVRA
jgi:hypothetical protein